MVRRPLPDRNRITPSSALCIATAQFNPRVGDLEGNRTALLTLAEEAKAQGADLLLSPELSLCGYPPEDLLLRPDFYEACDEALNTLAHQLRGIALIVGHPLREGGHTYNAATVLHNGERLLTYRKNRLPNYEVFDEKRYFDAGDTPGVFRLKGITCGLLICADIWKPEAAAQARTAGAELLLVLNASPLHLGKSRERELISSDRVAETDCPLVYANLVGGQDELVFDGGSFALNRAGHLVQRLPQFEPALGLITFAEGDLQAETPLCHRLEPEAEAYQALVLGVRDYVTKNGFPGVLIGLSGGIDSALTLCIAVDALGPEKAHAVMMPSPYTAQMSLDDARALAEALKVPYQEIPIESAMLTFNTLLSPVFSGLPADTTEENIQARIRGTLLMALSNKTGALVLTTGNKSEMAVGYATLYGDMAGGLAVIKDIYKTLVWKLARYRNCLSPVIPDNTITRPPSAELRPDQTDQDSLPDYETLDAIVQGYMEEDRSPEALIAEGLSATDVHQVVRLLRLAEYKRRQSPPGIRVTRRAFGRDWRYPITNRYSHPS